MTVCFFSVNGTLASNSAIVSLSSKACIDGLPHAFSEEFDLEDGNIHLEFLSDDFFKLLEDSLIYHHF